MSDELSRSEIDKLLGIKDNTDGIRELTQEDMNKREMLSLLNLDKHLNLNMYDESISWNKINELIKIIDYDSIHLPHECDYIPMIPKGNKYMTLELLKEVLSQASKEIERNNTTSISAILKQKNIIINSSVILIK